jgi:hypothetical protein
MWQGVIRDSRSHPQCKILPLCGVQEILRTAYAAWGVVQANDLMVTAGESGVTKFDSGGGLRVFCSSCGSPLWYEPANVPTFRGIPLGVIDAGDVPTPQMHVWMKSKVSWASFEDELPRHETHP